MGRPRAKKAPDCGCPLKLQPAPVLKRPQPLPIGQQLRSGPGGREQSEGGFAARGRVRPGCSRLVKVAPRPTVEQNIAQGCALACKGLRGEPAIWAKKCIRQSASSDRREMPALFFQLQPGVLRVCAGLGHHCEVPPPPAGRSSLAAAGEGLSGASLVHSGLVPCIRDVLPARGHPPTPTGLLPASPLRASGSQAGGSPRRRSPANGLQCDIGHAERTGVLLPPPPLRRCPNSPVRPLALRMAAASAGRGDTESLGTHQLDTSAPYTARECRVG
jgi:hypothetical protein